MPKKKLDYPIEISNISELKDIVGYHPCQKITFTCEHCGRQVTKSLHAVRESDELLCVKCLREKKGIEKYGSEESYKTHLRDTHVSVMQSLVKKYGSIDDVMKHRTESYIKTCLERYGVDNTSKLESHKERFRGENNPIKDPVNKEKARKSYTREKHIVAAKKAVVTSRKTGAYEISATKCKQTKMEKYGDPGFVNHEKAAKTFIERYGVSNGCSLFSAMLQTWKHENGYVTVEELSDIYDYYPEGIRRVIIQHNIPFVYKWRGMYISEKDIPENFESLLENSKTHCRSYGEIELFEFVHSVFEDAIPNDRTIITPYELDVYIPSHKVAIEFDGIKWHINDDMLLKVEKCLDIGVHLLRIFEDEWNYKKEICKSVIMSALKQYEHRIYARKCVVKEVPNDLYVEFMINNHIQGSINASIRLGLFYEGHLVQCIGIGKSRYEQGSYELYRMATLLNTQVIGGFSKLLKHAFGRYNINEMVSYVDRRLFNGEGYNKTGFEIIKTTPPSYFYVKGRHRYNRLGFQKHKLKSILPMFDENKSERENMEMNGFYRIYDCGTYKVKISKNELQ